MTGARFQKRNSAERWRAVSEKVRSPLGAMRSRVLMSEQNLPAPPYGYEVVKFRTNFANKANVVETVTLERADDGWKVAGVTRSEEHTSELQALMRNSYAVFFFT